MKMPKRIGNRRPIGSNRRRVGGSLGIAIAAAGAAALLATTLAATLGGFTATVSNTANNVATGTLLLQEGQGATTCLSTSSDTISSNSNNCTTIDDFGALTNAGVGSTATTTIAMKNVGTIAASALDLTPGTCTASANSATSPYTGSDTSGFCGKIDVTIQESGATSCVYPASSTAACPATPTSAGTLAGLAGAGTVALPGIVAGATASYVIDVKVSSSATNADQGLSANLPLTWELSQ